MKVKERVLNKIVDGKEIKVFTLENEAGMYAEVTNLGGILLKLNILDQENVLTDVVLGYDKFEDYLVNDVYFGAIIGRCANRTENAKIEIEGQTYQLAKNDGNNHLHGGMKGFNKVVWDSKIVKENNEEFLQLSYLSEDGEENYPGNVQVTVNYKFTEDNELVIEYYAKTDKETIVNLTNHSYFNLAGHDSGNILAHKLKIYGDKITAVNEESIPTGEIRNIKETPMDFTELIEIGRNIESDYDQINIGKGYDHNWIIDGKRNELKKVADVEEETKGIKMEVYSTMPGVQFYSANFLNGQLGKGGKAYNRRDGLCLETQGFPNAANNKDFPSILLKPEEEYRETTIYKFSC